MRAIYLWQHEDWPRFRWDAERLLSLARAGVWRRLRNAVSCIRLTLLRLGLQRRSNRIWSTLWTKLSCPIDANIYARQYMLCLPDKEVLQANLREWILEAEE